MKSLIVLITLMVLAEGTHAQGFLGRLKKEALDTAKNTVDDTAKQLDPNDAGNQAAVKQDTGADTQQARKDQRKKEYDQQMEREQANADQSKKQWEKDQARIKKMKADQDAEQAKLDAQFKEDKAKRDAEAVKRKQRQEEGIAQSKKEYAERQEREKNEARDKIFDALRTGDNMKTAEHAKTQLKNQDLWQDGMEKKIKEVIAERMSKVAQNKFPLSDTFKTPVKVYKEFESGMSLEWCRAKLETDGESLYTHNNTIVLKADGSKVTLIFKKMDSEKQPILSSCVVELPSSIRHSQVLDKYKSDIPSGMVKHNETPIKLPNQSPSYLMDGVSLKMEFSAAQVTDTVTSNTQAVTIESKQLVGKAYLFYQNDYRKVLVCESSKDGIITVPNGLNQRQKEAASVVTDQMLAEAQRTFVLIEDKAIAKALQAMQKEQQADEKKKLQGENAKALAF